MAAYGLRPCVEIQFADYMYPAYDQIVSEAARLRHRSAGDFTAPLVVRMPTGGGIFGGQTHSQSPEALFTHVAGLKTVVVSNPYDAKGLLIAAIEDPDPVMFLEYWQDEEATAAKFAGDWMLTGDQCVVDEDGYFHFVGRDDDSRFDRRAVREIARIVHRQPPRTQTQKSRHNRLVVCRQCK